MQKRYLIILIIITYCQLYSQPDITVGLIKHSAGSTDNGYVLFAPMTDTTVYLIDKCGYVVHKWVGHHHPGLSAYLLPNGKLLKSCADKTSAFTKAGGYGGIIEIVDWDGNVEWKYKLSTPTECQHHDLKYLPNGNILAIVWEKKNFDEVRKAGRDTLSFNTQFWTEKLQELRPIGKDSAEIVWEWKVWDHLVQDFDSTRDNYNKVELHPELIDLNYNSIAKDYDWHHMNSIDYNPELDQILLSSCNLSEIWIIDHSTTTNEAAGHKGGKYGKGGDLIYRWGNPQVYRQGTPDDRQLYFQHDATWIYNGLPYAGNIMIFDNLCGPIGKQYSSLIIIKPPVDSQGFYKDILPFEPKTSEWSYTPDNQTDFFALNLSSGQMLENGHVIICSGMKGLFTEIDTSKNMVWKYINPQAMNGVLPQGFDAMGFNPVFRCIFYPDDFQGFLGKELLQEGLVENRNANSAKCSLFASVDNYSEVTMINLYPNPTENILNINTTITDFFVEVYDINGEKRITDENTHSINISELENGVYYVKLIPKSELSSKIYKFIIWR